MKANTSKSISFYTQGQQFTARALFIVWLLASGSPESALATTTSPGDPSLASAPPTPGGILQLPPDSPGAFWGDSVASSPSIDAALQERMGQEAAPDEGSDLLRTSPKVSPVSEHFSCEAREGENVRFHYQMGQWSAEVSSHIGSFSRRAVLPVVCSQGADVASSLEVLSKYPSWQRQPQIHVLDRNVCPTLGEVVYVGELGLKGGGEGEASAQETPPANQSQPDRKRKASQELSLHSEASSPQRASDPNPDPGQSSTPPEQNCEVRQAVIKAWVSQVDVAPQEAPKIIRAMIAVAAKDSVRLAAIKALRSVSRFATQDVLEGKIIPTLTAASAEDSVRLATIEALESMTLVAPQEAPEIICTMIGVAMDENENEDVQKAAFKTLGAVASSAPSAALAAIPELIEKANILPLAAVRELFAKAAPKAPSEAENLIPQLIEYAESKDRKVCEAAINTLGAATPIMLSKHPEIIQSLIEATEHQKLSVRPAAIKALGAVAAAVPGEAPTIIPKLIEVAKDQLKLCSTRSAAFAALAQLASTLSPEVVQNIIQILKDAAQDRGSLIKKYAIEALGKVAAVLGEAPTIIIPTLIAAVDQDQGTGVREAATRALAKISIQQLLECYWAGPDPSFIPYITIRLLDIPPDKLPLQVYNSDTPQHLQVVLSATAGQPYVWIQPQEVVQCFTRLIRDEASQVEKGLECYKRCLAVTPNRDPGIPPNVEEVLCSVNQVHELAGQLKQMMQKLE